MVVAAKIKLFHESCCKELENYMFYKKIFPQYYCSSLYLYLKHIFIFGNLTQKGI